MAVILVASAKRTMVSFVLVIDGLLFPILTRLKIYYFTDIFVCVQLAHFD